MIPDSNALDQVNEFISHSKTVGKKPDRTVQVNNGQVVARLTTPLNSSFNQSGDEVKAVVVSSTNQNGKPWLEEGTILEGTVEASKKATYGQTDGTLVIRFYKAKFGDKQIELFTSSDTDDGAIKPEQKALTKKQKIRGVLMTVSRIAIPAAIGTGGMSIAISAGAGAAIGLAFSDKGKRIKGTVRGAYEGAGLSFLDPVICKGNTVVMAEGTPIGLQLNEPVSVPPYVGIATNTSNTFSDISGTLLSKKKVDTSVTRLDTHAQILGQGGVKSSSDSASEDDGHLDAVNRKIAQNDLAGALTALTSAEELYPQDPKLKQMHIELFNLVSGQSTASVQH